MQLLELKCKNYYQIQNHELFIHKYSMNNSLNKSLILLTKKLNSIKKHVQSHNIIANLM